MMLKRTNRRAPLGLPLLLMGACSASQGNAAISAKDLQEISNRMHAIESYQGEQECGDELRRLLADARAECSTGSPSVAGSAEGTGGGTDAAKEAIPSMREEDKCSSDQLRGAMVAAEQALNKDAGPPGKRKSPRLSPIAQMLDRFRCEVLYLDGESESVPVSRQSKLSDMSLLSHLPQTKYVILASSSGGEVEARHRADVMRRELTELKVDPEKIEKAWIYPFSLQLSQIHKRTLWPKTPSETADLGHAVWVCRTSC